MGNVILFGEPMALLIAEETGPWKRWNILPGHFPGQR